MYPLYQQLQMAMDSVSFLPSLQQGMTAQIRIVSRHMGLVGPTDLPAGRMLCRQKQKPG